MSDENRSGAAPSAQSQETIADISALLRDLSKGMIRYGILPTIYGKPIDIYFAELADRIDAANKREIEATAAKCCRLGRLAGYGASEIKHQRDFVGNVAKLREAAKVSLSTIRGIINGTISPRSNTVFDCRDELSAALSAPARNCDIGSVRERGTKCLAQFRTWRKNASGERLIDAIMNWCDTPYESEVPNGK